VALVCAVSGATLSAQQSGAAAPDPPDDGRAQYPALLSNAFVNLNVGYIDYPFSRAQLEPGHDVGEVAVPRPAVRAVLFGRHFGRYLSAQASYMRPVKYVRYRRLDGTATTRFVWMHYGTVTLLGRIPVGGRASIYGEGGLAIANRSGFEIDDVPVVRDAHMNAPLLGGGVEYRLNPTWDMVTGASYILPKDARRQPRSLFASTGFRYNLRPLPPERVEETRRSGYIFPRRLAQVAFSSNALGYGVNNFLSKKVPVFWGGKIEVERSLFSFQYQHNVFHTRKVFAIDFGASVSRWKSNRDGETFYTASFYPLLRFTLLRRRPADVYFVWSVAGPSYISREFVDGRPTGGRFTFQDFMGTGLFFGSRRQFNAEVGINHYSNGNILTENAGVKIPLTLKVGYAF
jgi:hypothetical protein